MSTFNSYAKDVDRIAKAAFKEYQDAESALKKAEERAKQYPIKVGMVTAEYEATSNRARADLIDAKEKYRIAKQHMSDKISELNSMRNKLIAAVEKYYYADPAYLDRDTVELLKSGILSAAEYNNLLERNAGNHTMQRVIAKYADEAAAKIAKEYGEGSNEAMAIRAVAHRGRENSGGDTVAAFNTLIDAYSRTANNPAMIGYWDELTSELIADF